MNELDLQPLIDAAVLLDQEEREVRSAELSRTRLAHGMDGATPASMEKRMREIGLLSGRTEMTRWTTPTLREKLRERMERHADHPEVMALMGRLLTQAEELRADLIRLRRGIRDLELVMVGAVRDLQQQSLDGRLLRLADEDAPSRTLAEIHEMVEKDHAQIADAMAAWKLSNGAGAVWSIRDASTVEEVEQALRRLERTGHSHRTGPLFAVARWSVRREPKEMARRA